MTDKKQHILAPICLFVYNRPDETRRTVEALKKNLLASSSELFIFSDGPRNDAVLAKVEEVRKYIQTIVGFKQIKIIESKVNKGLANSIIDGVSEIINKYGKVIVLEDDILVSRCFLKFMNDGLFFYKQYAKVMQISGFMFPIKSDDLPDTFFYTANTCWGWATWKRAWEKLEPDCKQILYELKNKKISWDQFNAMQGNEFKKQLFRNINGTLNTWAVRWHSSIILNNGTVVHPKISYIQNIGFNGNGENCKIGENQGSINDNLTLDVSKASQTNNELAVLRLKRYFKKKYSLTNKILLRVTNLLKIR